MSTHKQAPTQQLEPLSTSTSQLAAAAAPTEFHLFSKLPLEIRLRIYTLSLPGPRLIPLIYNPPSTSTPTTSSSHQHQRLTTPTRITHSRIKTHTPPPALLHTTHESRTHILRLSSLCLPLCGLTTTTSSSSLSKQTQIQTLYRPTHDILYFPSLCLPNSNSSSTLNASFNNFTAVHTLAAPAALRSVRRLAVSEDVFLEVEKGRWRRSRRWWEVADRRGRTSAFGVADGGNRYCSGAEIGMVKDVGSSGGIGGVGIREGSSKGGIDGVTVSNLEDFWDVVRRKFKGLEEVWIVGTGMEGRILGGEMDGDEGCLGQVLGEWNCNGRDGDGDGYGMRSKRRMSFRAKIERAVSRLEEETGWTAPMWRFLGSEEDAEEFSASGVEVVESKDIFGGDESVQHLSDDHEVAQQHDPWLGVEARQFVGE